MNVDVNNNLNTVSGLSEIKVYLNKHMIIIILKLIYNEYIQRKIDSESLML
jgi:hypothetical protein